jgi:Icc-related predicted phosphoesterase
MIKEGSQKGRHYGSFLVKRIIKELKPRLVICGHIHENQGIQKIGKTLIVNIGAAYKSKAALIEFPKNIEGKIKIKLIR